MHAPNEQTAFCDSLQVAANRDILLVASAGNDLESVEFPVNDTEVIGMGSLEWIGVNPVPQTRLRSLNSGATRPPAPS